MSLLSPRQRQCLELVRSGLTSPQIAARLNRSPRTVDQYVAEAGRRLNARGRAATVAAAILRGEI